MSNGKKKSLPAIRLSENIQLLLVSVAFAVAAWVFAKAGETDESRIQIPVQVTINNERPDERYEIRAEPAMVPVTIRYPKSIQQYLSSENFQFKVDLSGIGDQLGLDWSTRSFALTETNLEANVPQRSRVRLIKIGAHSDSVEVRARWRAQPARVRPDIVGEDRLGDGFQVVQPVRVSPEDVWIVGKLDAMDTIPRDPITSKMTLMTEKLSIAEHTQSFLETVPIRVPAGVEIVQPKNRMADVNIDIQEVQTIREFKGLRLDFKAVNPEAVAMTYREGTAVVTVFGPQSLLKQLGPESFELSLVRPNEEVPGTTKDVPIEAKFAAAVTPEVRAKLQIKSVTPKSLRIQYTARQTATTRP